MPTAKNGLWILNLHPKNHRKQNRQKIFFFNVASSTEVLGTMNFIQILPPLFQEF